MRHEFHPEALEEYREAANWYGNREPDLALRFVSEVEDAIGRILDGPERWRIIEDDVRRCLTHVFPYSILYTIEPGYSLSRSPPALANPDTGRTAWLRNERDEFCRGYIG